jgi:polar amino acid transport system ATP-binding protein
MSQENPILAAENIRKAFGDNKVLKGVSLSVARGEVVTLIGASGSGKSTFLRCLNLLEMPQDGELTIGGHHFVFGNGQRGPDKAQLALLRRDVGMSGWCSSTSTCFRTCPCSTMSSKARCR